MKSSKDKEAVRTNFPFSEKERTDDGERSIVYEVTIPQADRKSAGLPYAPAKHHESSLPWVTASIFGSSRPFCRSRGSE